MAGWSTSSAFIGRADELQRLEAVLDRAGQGLPQVVLLAGEAGVGKTRLLLAFADRAGRRGMRVLAGGFVELGDIGLAYLPVVDALRELAEHPEEAKLLARVAMTAPGLGRLLPSIEQALPPGGLAGDDLDQLQVFDAVRAVLVSRFVFRTVQEKCPSSSPQSGAPFNFWHPDLVTLHVWLWYPNPAGLYNGTNPYVRPFNHT